MKSICIFILCISFIISCKTVIVESGDEPQPALHQLDTGTGTRDESTSSDPVLTENTLPIPTPDPLSADTDAARYRTSIIDPVIALIPDNIRRDIFIYPEENLPILTGFLVKGADNDFHIIKRIHDCITDSIAYEFSAETSVYKFLRLKRMNCNGIAALLNEMAKFAGIKSERIVGYSNEYRFKNGKQGNHVWNKVFINDKWYIVDATHDKRLYYINGETTEKLPYSDNELFIHPQYKLLVNLRFNEKNQLVDNPVTLETFNKQQRKKLAFIRFGLRFTDQSFINQLQPVEHKWEAWGIYGLFDGFLTGGNAHSISIECPPDVEIHFSVEDDEGNTCKQHYFHYREGKNVVLLFSAPEKGLHNAWVGARYVNRDKWETIYNFKLIENKGNGPSVPDFYTLYTKQAASRYQLEIINQTINQKGVSGYYHISLKSPSHVLIGANIRQRK